ncbi:hypothetical protein ACLMAL_30440 [Nocardia sp. CWNU-33]|uniref:hypothetical protein n=1 Tax=Nocardia sp. CWNU-33 TaxID=3392117 RepID=UPI00398F4E5B
MNTSETICDPVQLVLTRLLDGLVATTRILALLHRGADLALQIVQLLDRIGVSRTAVDQLVVTVYGITVAAVENPEGWPRKHIESLIDRTLASVGITTPAGA